MIEIINPGGDYSQAEQVRYAVFVEEQGVPRENEMDEHDKHAYHAVLLDSGEPVGCGRVYFAGGIAKLGRVAVLPGHRRKGHALKICGELINIAASHGVKQVALHSQAYAVPLYEKLGFERVGGEFLEENIPHFKMVRDVSGTARQNSPQD